jgi:hypothetical protein
MFLAHSISPYKTPWLIVSITLPMVLLSAFFLQKVWGKKTRLVVSALVLAVIALSVFNAWQSSFLHVNEDNANKLSYVHTANNARNLLSFLEANSKKKKVVLQVENYSQWPLPWYFSLKKYSIARDQNLFSLLRQARSKCISGTECDVAVEKVRERLEVLGSPFILGTKGELGFLDANFFEFKDFELRRNYWLRLVSARQNAT